MVAVTYENTHTRIPRCDDTIHVNHSRGYAFETNGRFFHVYGYSKAIWTQSVGLTVSSPAGNLNLNQWVHEVFGARNIEPMALAPGEVIQGVWRPGLFYENQVHQALGTDEYMRRIAEQSLRVLIEKLDEIFLYIEPSQTGLQAYGLKTRELLILACTEVENLWTQFMRLANAAPARRTFTTIDYVKLSEPLHLAEYVIECRLIRNGYSIAPFSQWDTQNPTQSLSWYDAYNKTKHDRETHFELATLDNCLKAIAAAIVLFSVRHSPFPLLEGASTLTSLFTQNFYISLSNPDPKSFYIPAFNVPDNIRTDLFIADMTQYIKGWNVNNLIF